MRNFINKLLQRLKSIWPSKVKTMPIPKGANGANQKLRKTLSQKNILRKVPRISFKVLNERLFSPHTRPMIHKAFLTLSAVTLSYTAGKTLSYMVSYFFPDEMAIHAPLSGKKALDPSRLKVVAESGLFKSATQESTGPVKEDKKVKKTFICEEATRKGQLPLKLLYTTVLQDPNKSLASFQVRSSTKLKHFRMGEKIDSLARLDKIDRQRVIVNNLSTGQCEYIEAPNFKVKKAKEMAVLNPREGKKLMERYRKDGIENSGDSFNISKKALNKYLGQIDDIITQARAIQIKNPDGSLSFKVTDITPGSIYSALGIEDNDVIQEINGKKIYGLNEVMNLFGKIQSVEQLQLKIQKNGGEEHVFDYTINQ